MGEFKVIYVATLLCTYHGVSKLETRAISWADSIEKAEEHLGACGDECKWDHAVIEEVSMGYPIIAKNRTFYKLSQHKLQKIREPFWAEGIINFGIG